ncbi:hypothetical protein [Companilactobacillus sp.]|uniref:hypothetical protein n=1 Tax=Companilactobacillus sp. TaxID=2767905 RepID=UPI00263281B7|nr:hypothetical protein [Companilactobacillus sp.]
MGLLDKIKANANNRISNEDLPLGKYDGVLQNIKHGTAADFEVWRFIYEVEDQNHKPATLVDTMFVNSDPEKNENQLSFRIAPYYEAGIISDTAVEKATSNLEGFFTYLVKQMIGTGVTVKLSEKTYKGKTRRNVTLQTVNVDTTKDEDSDAPF